MKLKNKRKLTFIISGIILVFIVVAFLSLNNQKKAVSHCPTEAKTASSSAKSLLTLSKEKLKEFDGVKDPKIYIGLDCLVYDVTAGKDQYYGVGKSYHNLVGKDSSSELKIFGGDIIKQKYPVVGILEK